MSMCKYVSGFVGLLLLLVSYSVVHAAEGNPKKGERVFKKCKICHSIGEDSQAGNVVKIGPDLTGIIGRPAASLEGFAYSQALKDKAADGLVWNMETLSEFFAQPMTYVPGTKMAFVGLHKEKDIRNLLAYLKAFTE